MRVYRRKLLCTLCAITVLFFLRSALGYTSSSSEPMLPEGLIIKDIFKPGLGSPVGTVLLVQGRVVIIHKKIVRGYWAKKGLPLFKGDTIITQDKGRVRFKLIDESIMTLASRTKLVINKSVYDRVKKSRFSFLKMTLGKVRFWAKKLADLKRSEFRVKTPTFVVGVRGSDFIIRATPKLSEVTALEKTELEVVSLAFPEAKPVIVTDFERTIVEEGALPSEVEMVAPEEIGQMKEEFIVTPEMAESEEKVGVGQEKSEKKEGKGKEEGGEGEGEEGGKDKGEGDESQGEGEEGGDDEGKDGDDEGEKDQGGDNDEGDKSDGAEGTGDEGVGEEDVSAEGADQEGIVEEVPVEEGIGEEGVGEEITILVSDDELVMPEDLGELEEFEEPVVPDIVEVEGVSGHQEEVVEQQEEISEEQHEEVIEEMMEQPAQLPSFPGAPQ